MLLFSQILDRLKQIEAKLDSALNLLHLVLRKEQIIMNDLDAVATDLQELESAEDGVITLLTSISAQLKAAAGDQAKIDSIIASIDASKAKLAAAVVANTSTA